MATITITTIAPPPIARAPYHNIDGTLKIWSKIVVTLRMACMVILNPNNIFILMNKNKLNLIDVIMGPSNAIFMWKMWYTKNTLFIIINIQLSLMFLLVFIIWSPYQFGKLWMSLGALVKISKQTLQKTFNARYQR